ncbi:MAG: hypothetical protein QOF68_972, partial [Gaiellales bacterium]|nr:hypothetical protein [Gaiellales bacterium]
VVGDTGSALIAKSRGSSFYVWATRTTSPNNAGKPVGQACRIQIRDDGTRTSWHTNDHTFWIEAGPRGDARLPARRALASLVCASRAI